MSSLEEPRQEPDKDKYLTQPEREQLQRLLSQPEEFPRELGSWITDYVGTNAFLQKSQVQGLPLLNSQVQATLEQMQTVLDTLSVIGTTYTDTPGTTITTTSNGDVDLTGPSVSVPAGTYFCFASAISSWQAGGTIGKLRINNGATANPFGSTGLSVPLDSSGDTDSLFSYGSVTLASAGSLKVWASQQGNGTIDFTNMNLTALRTA